jgi:7-cyano-7-deazaguanine synthase
VNSSKKNINRKAVVLFSGGLDSTTCLAIAINNNFETYALTFHYGQRHQAEINAASEIAKNSTAVVHELFNINLAQFGGSSLTGHTEVPKGRSKEEMANGVPSTYVPARNTVFLSIALARAETIGASDIFIGVNALDYSGYPDCRPEFIEAFQTVANLATKASTEVLGTSNNSYRVHAPLQNMTKSEIIKKGTSLGVDYSLTMSCYDPPTLKGKANLGHCGHCDACILRKKGFIEAGIVDPTIYMKL